jgi:hypothetical protein
MTQLNSDPKTIQKPHDSTNIWIIDSSAVDKVKLLKVA